MIPPPSVSHKFDEVCKLQKALYGLKQAPRAWFQMFSTIIFSLGFFTSHHDSALFVKKTNAKRIFLSLYVNNMIITGDDGIASLKTTLSHHFAIKDLSVLCYFLGIGIASSLKGNILSKSKYIIDLFKCARLTENQIVDTPLEISVRYFPSNGIPLTDSTLY